MKTPLHAFPGLPSNRENGLDTSDWFGLPENSTWIGTACESAHSGDNATALDQQGKQ